MEWLKIIIGPLVSFITFLLPFGDKKLQEKSLDYDKKTAFQEEDLIRLLCVFLYQNHKSTKYENLKLQFIKACQQTNKIKCLKNSYLNHTNLILGDKIDFYVNKYIKDGSQSFKKCVQEIKSDYKNKDEDAIKFCEILLKFKSTVDLNNENYINKIPLLSLLDSITGKIDRLHKLNDCINKVLTNTHNDEWFVLYSEIRKGKHQLLKEKDITGINKYIQYFIMELNNKLLYREEIMQYFSSKESSREKNKQNKSKEFYPNFYNLIVFYFITGLNESQSNSYIKMRDLLLKLIILLKEEIDFSNESLMAIFRKLEWIKYKEDDEYDKPYYSSSYWILKNEICKKIFENKFFLSLDKNTIGSFMKTYYIEYDKMKSNAARNDLQNYFLKITKMLNKEQLILLSKEYNV
jgi:hypothetical protein